MRHAYDGQQVIDMSDKCGIYIIKNDINNKVYIGQSINIYKRIQEHFWKAECLKDISYNSALHSAIRKYGKEHFYYEVLEECDEKNINKREQYYIKFFNAIENGYNITYGGDGESQVDFQEIEKLFLQGYYIKDIAKITGHTVKTISTRLRGEGYETALTLIGKSPSNKGQGIKVEFQNMTFNSMTSLAEYLKNNIEVFKNKKIRTIVQGISESSKRGTQYYGYNFHRL